MEALWRLNRIPELERQCMHGKQCHEDIQAAIGVSLDVVLKHFKAICLEACAPSASQITAASHDDDGTGTAKSADDPIALTLLHVHARGLRVLYAAAPARSISTLSTVWFGSVCASGVRRP